MTGPHDGVRARLDEQTRRLDRHERWMDSTEKDLGQLAVLAERVSNLDRQTGEGFKVLNERMARIGQILISLVLALVAAGASFVFAIVLGVL